MDSTLLVFMVIIGIGIFLSFLRMLIGPTASDRAVAVDTITTTVVALLVLLGFVFKRYVYLDVSLVYSLLAFVGLVAIARFLEKGI
ncbi:MAG: monovalent cation/H+ antiporter complex subunit F [Candidatus Celaenobacter antarcticus]|nr:monovalent cation/H+ antiporter complex subunit F [Candidatus Celaenobacter antarcticus]